MFSNFKERINDDTFKKLGIPGMQDITSLSEYDPFVSGTPPFRFIQIPKFMAYDNIIIPRRIFNPKALVNSIPILPIIKEE